MKKTLLLILFAGVLLCTTVIPSFAGAPVVKFYGGGKDGQYIQNAGSACEGMGKIFDCQAVVSGGTGANKAALLAGEADFGLGMGGLVKKWEAEDPAFKEKVIVVRYVGGEALFAYGKPSVVEALDNWEGVKKNAFLVSFGSPGEDSGDYLTLKELQSGDNNPLADATITPFKSRADQVNAVVSGKVQLGFAAQFPNPENSFFKDIAKAGLAIMPVIDTDLAINSTLYKVKQVRVENASIKKWSKGKNIETMYVPVAIMARNPDTYQTVREQKIQRAAIERIKSLSEADLLPKAGWITNFMNDSADMSAEALAKVGEEMKATAQSVKESALGK